MPVVYTVYWKSRIGILCSLSAEFKASDVTVKILKTETAEENSQKKSTGRTRVKKEVKVEEEEEEEEMEAAPSTSKAKPKTKSGRWEEGELVVKSNPKMFGGGDPSIIYVMIFQNFFFCSAIKIKYKYFSSL